VKLRTEDGVFPKDEYWIFYGGVRAGGGWGVEGWWKSCYVHWTRKNFTLSRPKKYVKAKNVLLLRPNCGVIFLHKKLGTLKSRGGKRTS